MMKASRLPDKKEWERIVDEAFSSNEEHCFSPRYTSRKNTMIGGITMKRRTVDDKSRNGSFKLALSVAAVAAVAVVVPACVFLAGKGGGASAPMTDMDALNESSVSSEQQLCDELNSSPRDDLKYDLILPDSYPATYSVTKAKLKFTDTSLLEELFPGCTEEPYQYEEGENNGFKVYRYKTDDSFVYFVPGSLGYNRPDGNESNMILSTLRMAKSAQQIRSEFPETELSEFSSEASLSEMDRLVKALSIDVSEPQVYAVSQKEADRIFDEYYSDYPFSSPVKDDLYFIRYQPLLDGLPVADYWYPQTSGTYVSAESSIHGVFTADGMCEFRANYIAEVNERSDDEKICSPMTAVETMKEYFNNGKKCGTLYGCDLRAWVYAPGGTVTDEYSVRPVWVFGWQDEERDKPSPYYVDAYTGEIIWDAFVSTRPNKAETTTEEVNEPDDDAAAAAEELVNDYIDFCNKAWGSTLDVDTSETIVMSETDAEGHLFRNEYYLVTDEEYTSLASLKERCYEIFDKDSELAALKGLAVEDADWTYYKGSNFVEKDGRLYVFKERLDHMGMYIDEQEAPTDIELDENGVIRTSRTYKYSSEKDEYNVELSFTIAKTDDGWRITDIITNRVE